MVANRGDQPDRTRSTSRPPASPAGLVGISAIVAGTIYDRGSVVAWLGGRKSWRGLQAAGLRQAAWPALCS